MDDVTFGLLCESLGRVCSATRSLVTVQNMVAHTIARWGSSEQKEKWLPRLASGDAIAGLCITEEDVGSDAGAVRTQIVETDGGWAVTGRKRWVTCGMLADLFLVLGRVGEAPAAILVEGDAAGLFRSPVTGQLGLRGAQLAEIRFEAVAVPPEGIIGAPGFGFSHIASTTLDHGRFSIAWGCTGMAQGCLEESARYASSREQFGSSLSEHQLVRKLVSDMIIEVRAAGALCLVAARTRAARGESAIVDTMIAKYFASRAAFRAAADAVQIHGANGCAPGAPVERHYRDAKVMQIIEGSDQMQQLTICESAFREYAVGTS